MRIRLIAALAGTCLAVSAATAQTPTVQQEFEAAVAIDAKGDAAAALAAWEKLEARTKPGSRSRGLVLARKSSALFRLKRSDEAVRAVRAGLALLPATDASLAEDRWRAYFQLGGVATNAIDYATANEAFLAAEKAAPDTGTKLSALLAFVETAVFVDPAAAAVALTRIDALAAAGPLDKIAKALIARRHALLLLNRREFAAAQSYAMEAVKQLGGLTERTDTRDVSARSDVAIAALLAGKSDDARRYMAMTGAGRIAKGSFDPAVQMTPPDCGGEAGLKPADMAVVEFSIADDGSVFAVSPIYAAGGGAVAIEFARAARDWSWTPEQVKELPPFFRANARIEMRCSTNFERPSIGKMLDGDTRAWLAGKGLDLPSESHGSDAAAAPRQRAELAAAEAKAGGNALAILPALVALANNSVVGREETHALVSRALAIAQANGAPPLVRLAFEMRERLTANADSWRDDVYRRVMTPMLGDPVYAADPAARAVVRLLLADSEGRKGLERARVLLKQVADDPALPANDPRRVGALIRLASAEQATGNVAAARETFDRSGLAANQCAILDKPPQLVKAGGTFPEEALMWHFEGWTQTQFDVAPDGRVLNERAVLSYPPFVFTKAGNATLATARFSKTFRPDGGVGCGGLTHRVKFLLPG
jgi:tetratricopeptide (TPR) repeat protein